MLLLSVNRHLIDMSDSPLTTADGINVLLRLCISEKTAYYAGPLLLRTYNDRKRDRTRGRNTNKVPPEHYKTSPPLIFCLV
ncbi:hypothetical protein QQF64_011130 [Cirrhinus molitorella]|uniref:Uncharacterized protein n=1 Tax=Cirrhinus molitorella TaxID=172907 RepID=A0ABR3LYE9_9TELE